MKPHAIVPPRMNIDSMLTNQLINDPQGHSQFCHVLLQFLASLHSVGAGERSLSLVVLPRQEGRLGLLVNRGEQRLNTGHVVEEYEEVDDVLVKRVGFQGVRAGGEEGGGLIAGAGRQDAWDIVN